MLLLVVILGFWGMAAASLAFGIRLLIVRSRSSLHSAVRYPLIIGVLNLAWAAFWMWVFRDGIGDARASRDGLAFSRFWQQFQFPLLVIAACALVGIICYGFSSWR